MADIKLEAGDRINGPLGFLRSSVAAQWRHRCVDHSAADKDRAFSHSWVLEDWKESGMSEELSAKAKAARLELNERAASDQPLMVEWDIQAELEKRELVLAAPHGGCLITKKGRAYVQEMNG
jgi:hypothetical protein